MANTIAYAQNYAAALDEKFVAESVTKHFDDANMKAQFVGAKQVWLPEMELSGLGNYDRATGFSNGAITITRKMYQLEKDRSKSFALDRMDADEAGVAHLAGKVMGRFVAEHVVPEVDTYVISRLSQVAAAQSQTATWDASAPVKVFEELLGGVQDAVGYNKELICFIDRAAFAALKSTPEFMKNVDVSNFKQGEVNTTIRKIDNVTLIPVQSDRMKDAITLLDTEAGGFSTTGAKDVHMLMLPKTFAHLVKKTEKVRVFSPDVNQDMDAYKFDYRIYYDVFVKNSELKGVWASFGE